MDANLPTEILEYIIGLIPKTTRPFDNKVRRENKDALLTCALVCKTWMVLARRRFLSSYFPSGRIAMDAEPNDTLLLNDVFRSPLCTFDPAFIKVLDFDRDGSFRTPDRTDLFAALFVFDARIFPSLQAIEFDGNSQIRFHEEVEGGGSGDDGGVPDKPVQPHLSPIKSLKIRTRDYVSFEDIISVIHLFPSLEQLAVSSVHGDDYGPVLPHPHYHQYFPNPPTSLRKLTLCMESLPEMTKWMVAAATGHTRHEINISSFTLISSWWNSDIECGHLRSLLDRIGPSLEDLTLKVYEDRGPFVEFATPDSSVPLDQFRKNTSIKHFTLTTDLDIAVKLLHYLLAQPHFAPQLEVLQVNVLHSVLTEAYLEKLKMLGPGYVHSRRPMLRRIVLLCPWNGPLEEDRGGVGRRIVKECLAQWEDEGVTVELRLT